MQAARLRAAALLAALLAALSLAACGGRSAPTTTATQSSGEVPTPSSKQPLPGHPRISARPLRRSRGSHSSRHFGGLTRAGARRAERRAKARQAAHRRALAKKAGRAAPFLVPVGDNSIPTYGSESSAAQRGEAEAALRAYLQARAAGQWSAACAKMAAAVQKQLALLTGESGGNCASAYAKLAAKIPASGRANPLTGALTALRVEVPHAFALFYGPGEQRYMMPMVSEGGAWRVNQLEAIPWPIGSHSP